MSTTLGKNAPDGAQEITLATTLRPSPEVLFRELSGESVLLDLKSQQYFGLNKVGTRIWQLVAEHGTLSAVIDALVAEYDVEPDRLRQDVLKLSQELIERGMVTVETAAQP